MTSHRIFEGVLQDLRVAIAQGRIAPGERLPTERALAQQFRVKLATTEEAKLDSTFVLRPRGGLKVVLERR